MIHEQMLIEIQGTNEYKLFVDRLKYTNQITEEYHDIICLLVAMSLSPEQLGIYITLFKVARSMIHDDMITPKDNE